MKKDQIELDYDKYFGGELIPLLVHQHLRKEGVKYETFTETKKYYEIYVTNRIHMWDVEGENVKWMLTREETIEEHIDDD